MEHNHVIIHFLGIAGSLAPPGSNTDTEAISKAWGRDRELQNCGRTVFISGGSKPWFGTSSALRQLHEADLVTIDPGVAQYHRWDQPAPEAERLYVRVTDAGWAALAA